MSAREPRAAATPTDDEDAPVFLISVAAQLAGMHAQTLRQYDRMGLVSPTRARGGGRRYSARDVAKLVRINELSQHDGVSLAGVERILDLEAHVSALQSRVTELINEVARLEAARLDAPISVRPRIFAVGSDGEVRPGPLGERPARHIDTSSPSRALVLWGS